MESVLLKANLVNLSTGQYWLNFDGEKGMSDHEGHGHKAVLYKSHFPTTEAFLLERHHCIHRLINHVYNKDQTPFVMHCPTTPLTTVKMVHGGPKKGGSVNIMTPVAPPVQVSVQLSMKAVEDPRSSKAPSQRGPIILENRIKILCPREPENQMEGRAFERKG